MIVIPLLWQWLRAGANARDIRILATELSRLVCLAFFCFDAARLFLSLFLYTRLFLLTFLKGWPGSFCHPLIPHFWFEFTGSAIAEFKIAGNPQEPQI